MNRKSSMKLYTPIYHAYILYEQIKREAVGAILQLLFLCYI